MAKLTFLLEGNIPPKKNSKQIFFRGGKQIVIPSKAHKEWHSNAKSQLMTQIGENPGIRHAFHFPIEKCNDITLDLYYGTLRGKDNTNTAESVLDLLVDHGIIEDDKWQVTGSVVLIPHYRKGQPGCRVTIDV